MHPKNSAGNMQQVPRKAIGKEAKREKNYECIGNWAKADIMQLVPNKGFVQTESYIRKNKHMQLDISAHTKNDSKLEKAPVALNDLGDIFSTFSKVKKDYLTSKP